MSQGTTARGLRGRRLLVATGALLGIATAAIVPTVGTQTSGTDDPAPDSDDSATATAAVSEGIPGAFEPCTAFFGFGKVGQVEVTVDGAVPSPPLTFPEDVDIVAEVTVAGDPTPTLCMPVVVTEELWASESTPGGILFGIPYPGGNYIFVPQNDACPDPFDEPFCDGPFDPDIESVTLRIVAFPGQYVLVDGEVEVAALENGYDIETEVDRVFPFALGTLPPPPEPTPAPVVDLLPTFTG